MARRQKLKTASSPEKRAIPDIFIPEIDYNEQMKTWEREARVSYQHSRPGRAACMERLVTTTRGHSEEFYGKAGYLEQSLEI